MRRVGLVIVVGLVAATAVAAARPLAAKGVTTGYATLLVAGMPGREYSDHNKAASSVCGAFVPFQNGGENQGDLDNGEGSYLSGVTLPQLATVTTFHLFVNDADKEADVHAYLYRKKIQDGLTPPSKDDQEMAFVESTAGLVNTMRLFTDATISKPTVDNTRWQYYVEVVDCGIPEPYSVQIIYTTP